MRLETQNTHACASLSSEWRERTKQRTEVSTTKHIKPCVSPSVSKQNALSHLELRRSHSSRRPTFSSTPRPSSTRGARSRLGPRSISSSPSRRKRHSSKPFLQIRDVVVVVAVGGREVRQSRQRGELPTTTTTTTGEREVKERGTLASIRSKTRRGETWSER